jgi:hypothetical protein
MTLVGKNIVPRSESVYLWADRNDPANIAVAK